MKTFWLIRHGESTSNAGAVTKDPGSTPLTEKGRTQAQYMADAFTAPPNLIVTSPYIRTQQTAAPTRDRYPNTPHSEWLIQEFNSLAAEKYNGTTGAQRRPLIREYWRKADPTHKDDGAGESFLEILGRVETMFTQLRETDSDFTALFAHGIFNSIAMWYWLHLESKELAAHRMRYFPLFRLGFDTRNCSYIAGQLDNNGRVTLSPLQTKHLPPKKIEFKPVRTIASAMIRSAIHSRNNQQQ